VRHEFADVVSWVVAEIVTTLPQVGRGLGVPFRLRVDRVRCPTRRPGGLHMRRRADSVVRMAVVTPNSVLAQNLDRLLTLKGLGRKEAAEAIGVPYKWLRRAVSQGLARSDRRNTARLQSVTAFFGLRKIDDLWRPSLVELRLVLNRRDEAIGIG
jgi:hypothetical protein